MRNFKFLTISVLASLCFIIVPAVSNAQSVPDYFVYEGRLLNSAGNPVITNHDFRFSFWSSADFNLSDILGDGSINSAAATYGGWQEVHAITPNGDGFFSVELGTINPFPQIDSSIHKYLQLEVKRSGDPDVSYELLDPTGDNGVDAIDRSPIGSVPYAVQSENASRSLNETFIVDYDNTIENAGVGEIKLQFGQTLSKYLSYDYGGGYFNFNDSVRVDGDLDVTGTISGFSSSATLNNGDLLIVSHPSSINHYFTAIALKYIQNSGLTDTRLDYDTADEGNYSQENSAIGTDFISDEVRLHDSGAGVSNKSYPYSVLANYTFDTNKIDVSSGIASLKQTPNWGNIFGYYKMDSDWNDSSDSGNNATANGGPTFDLSDYKVGTASGQFDGSNDYIIVNPVSSFPSSEISVEFWMKTSDTTKNGTPFSYAVASQNNEFLIFNYRSVRIFRGGSYVSTGVALNDGAWHHVVVTWRGSDGQTRLYKDGVLSYSGTLASGTSITGGGAMVIGQEQDNVGGGFDITQAFLGRLDEYVVYNKVLSASDVSQRYNSGAGRILAKYYDDKPSIQPSSNFVPALVTSWTGFSESLGGANQGSVCYNLSDDGGVTWKYWNGTAWSNGGDSTNCSSASVVNSNMSTFDNTPNSILYRAFLVSNGYQKVEVDVNNVSYSMSSYPTGQSYYVSTTNSSQLSTVTWEKINSVTIDDVTPAGTGALYLISFDGRATWKYWDGSAWQTAVDTGAGESLSDATAFSNGNTDNQLEALTSLNWASAGGFNSGTTSAFDVAMDLITSDAAKSPSVTQITVNYDEIGIWRKIQGTDADNYPIEFISPTQTRVTNNSGLTQRIQLFVR